MDLEVIRKAAISTGKSVQTILNEITEPDSPPDETEEDPAKGDPEEELQSLIVIGEAEGKPGETVRIEVLGRTNLPVTGFGLAVGCDRSLTLVGSDETKELKDLLGIDPQTIQKQHKGAGWKDTFIQIGSLWFQWLLTQDELEAPIPTEAPKRSKRTFLEARIVSLMPIYTFKIQIPADAKVGTKYELDADQKYGHLFQYADGRGRWILYPSMYTTSQQVAKWGIEKKNIGFVSGWIKVVT